MSPARLLESLRTDGGLAATGNNAATDWLSGLADPQSPFVSLLFNNSLTTRRFPSDYNQVFLRPVLKKTGPP